MVELRGVTKIWSGQTVLDEINVRFVPGSFTSVIGPSGAGKSTLLRLINGMERPSAGQVFVLGRELSALRGGRKRAVQRMIGTVWQDFRLVEQSDALKNVLNGALGEMNFFCVLLGLFGAARKARAHELLARVGLQDKAAQRAASLSGGEKQRCAIARALMQGCKIILADEPVASLDPVHAQSVLSLLKKLQREGATVIMNSHNVEQACAFSDRIIGLRGGKIVFSGAPGELTPTVQRTIYGETR